MRGAQASADMVSMVRDRVGGLDKAEIVVADSPGFAEQLNDALGERFTLPQLLRRKVSGGDLERKTGHGFLVLAAIGRKTLT